MVMKAVDLDAVQTTMDVESCGHSEREQYTIAPQTIFAGCSPRMQHRHCIRPAAIGLTREFFGRTRGTFDGIELAEEASKIS